MQFLMNDPHWTNWAKTLNLSAINNLITRTEQLNTENQDEIHECEQLLLGRQTEITESNAKSLCNTLREAAHAQRMSSIIYNAYAADNINAKEIREDIQFDYPDFFKDGLRTQKDPTQLLEFLLAATPYENRARIIESVINKSETGAEDPPINTTILLPNLIIKENKESQKHEISIEDSFEWSPDEKLEKPLLTAAP